MLDDSSVINDHSLADWDVIYLKRVRPLLAEGDNRQQKKNITVTSNEVLHFGDVFSDFDEDEKAAISFDLKYLFSLFCCVRDDAADFGTVRMPSKAGLKE